MVPRRGARQLRTTARRLAYAARKQRPAKVSDVQTLLAGTARVPECQHDDPECQQEAPERQHEPVNYKCIVVELPRYYQACRYVGDNGYYGQCHGDEYEDF